MIDGAAEAPVYANSGKKAERDQSLNDGDNFTHYLKQAVVLFPTAKKPVCSSMPPPSSGRPAATTPTRRASRSGPSGRSPTRTAHEHPATQQNASAPGWGVDARYTQKQCHYRHQHVQRQRR